MSPLLSSQGIALVSPPATQMGMIRDTTSGFLHPPGQRGHTDTQTYMLMSANNDTIQSSVQHAPLACIMNPTGTWMTDWLTSSFPPNHVHRNNISWQSLGIRKHSSGSSSCSIATESKPTPLTPFSSAIQQSWFLLSASCHESQRRQMRLGHNTPWYKSLQSFQNT